MIVSMLERRSWTGDETVELIRRYECYPELWDLLSYNSSKNREQKLSATKSLSTYFHTTDAEINRKLHNLRSQMFQEIKKGKRNYDGSFVSSWPYFDSLKFILSGIKSRHSIYKTMDVKQNNSSTAAIKKEDDQTDERDDVVSLSENDIKVELIEYGSQVADQDEGMVQPTFVPNSKRVKELADDNLNSLPVMDRTLEDPLNTTQVRLRPLDDSQVFGDFVASELRNLRSEENRRKLRRVIQQSILQISELDDFENKIMNNEPH